MNKVYSCLDLDVGIFIEYGVGGVCRCLIFGRDIENKYFGIILFCIK